MSAIVVDLYRSSNPKQQNPGKLLLHPSNYYHEVSFLFLCVIDSIVIAAKFFDDRFFVNSYYAKIGGLSTEELNVLEMDFLYSINFTLHVSSADYQNYHNELFKHIESGACPCCRRLSIVCISRRWTFHSLSNFVRR